MLRIRLRRVGKKKQPMYRIVVADSHAPRDGAFVENLGYYHPMDNPSTIVLDEERAKHWLGKGATPSTRVAKILKIQGVAELPEKVAKRVALGEQRKAEAATAAKKKASDTAGEAKAEEPTAKAATAEEPKAEAKTPSEDASTEDAPAEHASAEAAPAEDSSDDKPAEADDSSSEAPADEASAKDEEQAKE